MINVIRIHIYSILYSALTLTLPPVVTRSEWAQTYALILYVLNYLLSYCTYMYLCYLPQLPWQLEIGPLLSLYKLSALSLFSFL